MAELSILDKVRIEARRDGYDQASQLSHDEAYYDGQCAGRAEAPSRLRWFLFGAAVASLFWLLT